MRVRAIIEQLMDFDVVEIVRFKESMLKRVRALRMK